ncbi:MAG TPA: AMP-binding protein, partial [Methylomirabilota bacterium]|nr:AMP-binding protein [Methylomirabilota bacterium]
MNVAQHVERAAAWFPDHPAILFEGGALSYRELNDQANRLAHALRAHGVGRGDRVALYLPNIPAFAVCYEAALKVGAVAVSINSIFKADEVKHILDDSGARVLFTAGELLASVPHTDGSALERLVVCEGDAQGHATLAQW